MQLYKLKCQQVTFDSQKLHKVPLSCNIETHSGVVIKPLVGKYLDIGFHV